MSTLQMLMEGVKVSFVSTLSIASFSLPIITAMVIGMITVEYFRFCRTFNITAWAFYMYSGSHIFNSSH